MPFRLEKPFEPSGDQPEAIRALIRGIESGESCQTLMGVTGSGKTFTMANVIEHFQRPTLVMSHNKTLAAQLYGEFKAFFPENAVSYFVSYYDYYQPEAYIPQRDIYIEKDSSINDEIDRLRLAATSALLSRRDCIVVASVSSIYGLGSPDDYQNLMLPLRVGVRFDRDEMLKRLVDMLYERNDVACDRGNFRVRGDCVEIRPTYEEFAVRIEFWGDEIEQIAIVNPLTNETIEKRDEFFVYPAKHFVLPEEHVKEAVGRIEAELEERVKYFTDNGKLLEAQRLSARTRYDLELIQETGFCPGIENYSAPLAGRAPGVPPETLFDYFPDDFLLFIDESHVTIPQIRAMFSGDQSRKKNLIDHGFRLPSALDNRPLKFEEWEKKVNQVIYVSATPGEYELKKSGNKTIQQLIRPTGLVDPIVEVVAASIQIAHLLDQARERIAVGERVLVTALTKKLAEEVADYFVQQDIRCRWLHSELDAFERVELLQDLRSGNFDVLVGVNLLREGLDLPEVSLVAILDADKEGFLRSETSLIQTIGRSARNVNAKVILYADKITDSMKNAIDETNRRRAIQIRYNTEHGITPETIKKNVHRSIEADAEARARVTEVVDDSDDKLFITREYINELEQEMLEAAENLEFEKAAVLRDRIKSMSDYIGKKASVFKSAMKKEAKTKGRRGHKKRSSSPSKRVPKPEKGC
ncbi:MAG: excinuclease ABC subunit UvrB [Thermoguttaceae bacterium]|jgi:excinuclease ABC subunit B